jgi:hypothetical protein
MLHPVTERRDVGFSGNGGRIKVEAAEEQSDDGEVT